MCNMQIPGVFFALKKGKRHLLSNKIKIVDKGAKKMYQKTVDCILEEKIVVIVRGVERKDLIPLAEAIYDGGIRLMELTYSADKSIADEEIADRIRELSQHFAGRMLFGAGTVLSTEQVELTKQAGGAFIISPDMCPAVIRKTKELGMVSMPGAVTPTEIRMAHDAGADFVKVFPATNLGPSYFKAVTAPLSHIRLTAVGGVNEENLKDYLAAGACGVGLGANIVDKKKIADGDFQGITELAKRYVSLVK